MIFFADFADVTAERCSVAACSAHPDPYRLFVWLPVPAITTAPERRRAGPCADPQPDQHTADGCADQNS
jgi:hypothetical protein